MDKQKIARINELYHKSKAEGLTAAELAEMIGRSHDFVRQIESEKVGYNFSVETFYRIAVALDVGMDVLAGKTIENKK